jgi:hypothetical protein
MESMLHIIILYTPPLCEQKKENREIFPHRSASFLTHNEHTMNAKIWFSI